MTLVSGSPSLPVVLWALYYLCIVDMLIDDFLGYSDLTSISLVWRHPTLVLVTQVGLLFSGFPTQSTRNDGQYNCQYHVMVQPTFISMSICDLTLSIVATLVLLSFNSSSFCWLSSFFFRSSLNVAKLVKVTVINGDGEPLAFC